MELELFGLRQTVGPTSEPLTLTEAKKHLELATADTTHDDHVGRIIAIARDQFEHDTHSQMIRATWVQSHDSFEEEFRLSMSPAVSVTSVKYYDGSTQQTVSSSIYTLDTARNEVRLAYNQVWPSCDGREYGIEITYVAGYATTSTNVPPMAKQAMLLLVGHYFGNRGDDGRSSPEMTAYEALVRRMQRSTYP